MCEVDCPYKDKCKSYSHKCGRCSRNKARKKDYFCPDYWEPCYPTRPYCPYTWPYTIWTSNDNYTWTTSSYDVNSENSDYFIQT